MILNSIDCLMEGRIHRMWMRIQDNPFLMKKPEEGNVSNGLRLFDEVL